VNRMGEAPQIPVTGATGFIGTHLVGKLAEEGRPNGLVLAWRRDRGRHDGVSISRGRRDGADDLDG
jgi:uncharacterized protein YbjT (DUF2867 family)